ncbi:3-deoxy-D-manno-octulosonic acid transferase [uncultured Psychrobacter sp.]|uniref:3-deoxy-D-manno-octulosonic acid transferase n=1 Tax=uncultured Psychrobacter sp. TaxID=259303 RepID=UPI00345A5504
MSSSHTSSSEQLPRLSLMPPWYYRFIITILKPLYRIQVWRRSHKRDNYHQEVAQRFGKHYPPRPTASIVDNVADNTDNNIINNKVIWCHAVSLGETNTAAPLLDALLAKGYRIWLTNTTQTGFARGASRFADEIAQGRMSHSYVPVDSPAVIETFLAHVQPIAALFVETELWANILAILSQKNIASILVNGRLSEASFMRYQKISAVSTSMMQNLTLIIAQDEDSAKRFRQLGAQSAQIRVAGSLKWVINTPQTIMPQMNSTNNKNPAELQPVEQNPTEQVISASANELNTLANRPVWIAASTHSGEEETALIWQQQLLAVAELKETLLIIVPRHPERFDEVASLIEQSGLQMARRSQEDALTAQTQVYLADTMGELMHWYAQANVALVGGSLVDIGGHNPVEPTSVATPVLMGRYTQSCQSVVDKLASVGALYQPDNEFYQAIETFGNPPPQANQAVPNKEQSQHSKDIDSQDAELIYQQLQFWLSHSQVAKQAGQAGKNLTAQQQLVLTRQLSMIETTIEKTGGKKAVSDETL